MSAEKPEPRPVRACICYPRQFSELKELARQKGWTTVEEITENVGCGSGCGLCRPYLAQMLATGETAFPVRKQPPSLV